jgi:hypothetical protein
VVVSRIEDDTEKLLLANDNDDDDDEETAKNDDEEEILQDVATPEDDENPHTKADEALYKSRTVLRRMESMLTLFQNERRPMRLSATSTLGCLWFIVVVMVVWFIVVVRVVGMES